MGINATRFHSIGWLALLCSAAAGCGGPQPPCDMPHGTPTTSATPVVPGREAHGSVHQPAHPLHAAHGRSVQVVYPREADISSGCIASGRLDRLVPADAEPVRFTLLTLLDGPTEQEETITGVFSPFDESPSAPTATDLGRHFLDITVEHGVATVDFARAAEMFFLQAACPSAMVTSSIEQTLTQFSHIRAVRFAIEGAPITQWEGEVGPRG